MPAAKYQMRMAGRLVSTGLLASFLLAGVALAQSDERSSEPQSYVYLDLFGIDSITEYIPGIAFVPMFDGAGCEVDEPTVKSLVRLESQKDRGLKLRFVSSREFREREKELRERPTKILEAGKQTIAEFMDRPEGTLWKEAVRDANHYQKMPVLNFTVRTSRIEQTCFAFIEAKLTTHVDAQSRLVTVELWSDDRSVRVSQVDYTASIASATRSLLSQLIDDWKRTQTFCAAQTTPCSPSIANQD
jgi:hypothetical protein